ncbi:MAG: rod-binding protein [Phycisphaerae bacterium]|jgi:Rod binding domain-containing protein
MSCVCATVGTTSPTLGTKSLANPAGSGRALAALQGLGRRIDAHDPRLAKDAAGKLLADLFFAPLLAEMRKSASAVRIGSGGRGEEVFGEQLDQRLADAVAAADRSGLRAAIERKLLRAESDAPSAPRRPHVSPAGTAVGTKPLVEGV